MPLFLFGPISLIPRTLELSKTLEGSLHLPVNHKKEIYHGAHL